MKIMTKAIDRCADCIHMTTVTWRSSVTFECRKGEARRRIDETLPYEGIPSWCPLPERE